MCVCVARWCHTFPQPCKSYAPKFGCGSMHVHPSDMFFIFWFMWEPPKYSLVSGTTSGAAQVCGQPNANTSGSCWTLFVFRLQNHTDHFFFKGSFVILRYLIWLRSVAEARAIRDVGYKFLQYSKILAHTSLRPKFQSAWNSNLENSYSIRVFRVFWLVRKHGNTSMFSENKTYHICSLCLCHHLWKKKHSCQPDRAGKLRWGQIPKAHAPLAKKNKFKQSVFDVPKAVHHQLHELPYRRNSVSKSTCRFFPLNLD